MEDRSLLTQRSHDSGATFLDHLVLRQVGRSAQMLDTYKTPQLLELGIVSFNLSTKTFGVFRICRRASNEFWEMEKC